MPFTLATDTSSLLLAPLHHEVAVTWIGFDSIRDRCAELGIAEGTRLVVRERCGAHVVVHDDAAAPLVLDAMIARFVAVTPVHPGSPAMVAAA